VAGSESGSAETVILRSADGRTLTTEDLRGATGTFRYEISGGYNVPAEADSLHQQAREAGQRGDHKKAIALLDRASQLAPRWPYPVYDKAYEYLLMKDFSTARIYYQKTLELAPRGFFTAITAVDALTREQNGELPVGTYLAYVSLESINKPTEKAEAVRVLVKRVPELAPAWKELVFVTDDDSEKLAIVEKGLAAHPDPETKGMLQINKALIMNRTGNHDAAIRLLGELALDPNSTFATEHFAKSALAILLKR